MESLQYFAYGSNMLRARLVQRGVELLDAGQAAQVKDFNLVFNKKSNDGSAKANLVPAAKVNSWGVVYSVSPNSLAGLDSAEGAPDHYRRASIIMLTPQGERAAMTYLAQPEKVLLVPDHPWDWYLALILAGVKACPAIPVDWLKHLRKIGNAKRSYGKPEKAYAKAIVQLRAANHERWQDLLVGN